MFEVNADWATFAKLAKLLEEHTDYCGDVGL